jgi:hypothetical protein
LRGRRRQRLIGLLQLLLQLFDFGAQRDEFVARIFILTKRGDGLTHFLGVHPGR